MEPYFLFIAFTLGGVAVAIPMARNNIKLKKDLKKVSEFNNQLMLRETLRKLFGNAKKKDEEKDKTSEA